MLFNTLYLRTTESGCLTKGICFANQICPYMFECFHDTTYKTWEGAAGWVQFIIMTAALTEPLPRKTALLLQLCKLTSLKGGAVNSSIFTAVSM